MSLSARSTDLPHRFDALLEEVKVRVARHLAREDDVAVEVPELLARRERANLAQVLVECILGLLAARLAAEPQAVRRLEPVVTRRNGRPLFGGAAAARRSRGGLVRLPVAVITVVWPQADDRRERKRSRRYRHVRVLLLYYPYKIVGILLNTDDNTYA